MRNAWKSKLSAGWTFVALSVVVAFALGCSDDEPGMMDGGSGTSRLVVENIIFNPKSPAPGDTVRITAVVTSDSANVGLFAKFVWSNSGGVFLEDNKTSVRWVAPDTSLIFSITVKASNGTSSATLSSDLFVGRLEPLINVGVAELHPLPGGDRFYYLFSSLNPVTFAFRGFAVWLVDRGAGTNVEIISSGTALVESEDFMFNSDLSFASHVQGDLLFVDDLVAGTKTALPLPPQSPFIPRATQFSEPYFSPNGQIIAFQAMLPDKITPPPANTDSFQIYIHDVTGAALNRTRVTFAAKNFHPTISPDGALLVFVSDRSGSQQWELYGVPIVGGTVLPDTVPSNLTQLSSTGGLMGSQSTPPADQLKAWSPNRAIPILAITNQIGSMVFVPADGSGAVSLAVGTKGVKDLAWRPDGSVLAVSIGGEIHRVDPSPASLLLYEAPKGDALSELSWSPDGRFLIYNVVRLGESWYELIDVDGAAGLDAPLKITSAGTAGERSLFQSLADLRPVWSTTASSTAYLFFLPGATPSASGLDLSGVAP